MILGASRYYLKSIVAAKQAGYFVIALDKNPQAEGFCAADIGIVCDIINYDDVLKISRQYNIDGIVPVNDYGIPTAAYVAEKMNLPGISRHTALLATNKEEMRKEWIKKGVPCPRVEVVYHEREAFLAVEKVGLPCVFKPAHGIGGGSRGVVVVNSALEINAAFKFAQSFYEDKAILVESYIDAEIEHSAEVIVQDGIPHIIAIADKIKTPLPYRVDKNVVYPTVLQGERLQSLQEHIKAAVLALNIHIGAAHVELATTANGPVLFELGARCGGGGTPEPIVPYVTGVQEFVEVVRILCGDRAVNLVPKYSKGCNYHFLLPEPGIVKCVEGISSVESMEEILDVEVFVKPGERIVPVKVGAERSGFIIAGGVTRDEAIELGRKAEQQIRFVYQT